MKEFKEQTNSKLESVHSDLNAAEVLSSKKWNDIAKLKDIK